MEESINNEFALWKESFLRSVSGELKLSLLLVDAVGKCAWCCIGNKEYHFIVHFVDETTVKVVKCVYC